MPQFLMYKIVMMIIASTSSVVLLIEKIVLNLLDHCLPYMRTAIHIHSASFEFLPYFLAPRAV